MSYSRPFPEWLARFTSKPANPPVPLDERVELDPDSVDPDTYGLLHADARRSLDLYFEAIVGLGGRAVSLVQLNGAVLAILTGLTANVVEPREYVSVLTIVGALAFFGSIILAGLAILSPSGVPGVGRSNIAEITERNLSREEYLEYIVQKDSTWLADLGGVIARRGRLVKLSTILFVVGIVAFTVGVTEHILL